jgi:hypothetical protein
MSVTEQSIERLKRDYPKIAVVARRSVLATNATFLLPSLRSEPLLPTRFSEPLIGPVLAVRVQVQGIRGGHSPGGCPYELIIDTSNLRGAIPNVWVMSPPDRDIKHVNIWPAHKLFCSFALKNLPSFCWGSFATRWSQVPSEARTLGNALEYAKQFLNEENRDSPAR